MGLTKLPLYHLLGWRARACTSTKIASIELAKFYSVKTKKIHSRS